MTPFQIKCPWKIRESELMACSRHLGKILVKMSVGSHGCPHSGALWSNPKGKLQLVFSHISKTRRPGLLLCLVVRRGKKMVSFFLLSLQLVCVFIVLLERVVHSKSVSKCPVFTSCLWAGWALRCPNGPVRCCHSLSHHTDPGGEERQQDVKNSSRQSF